MSVAISPKHVVDGGFPPAEEWPLEFKIDIFIARVDGWHLEVADRCINGWQNPEGQQCITAPCGDMFYYESPTSAFMFPRDLITHQIPDAGWAVLQMVLNYFEIIGRFKFFKKSESDDDFLLFQSGVLDVFPGFKNHEPNIARLLYSHLRGGLYHSGIRSGKIFLRHQEPLNAMVYDSANDLLIIDPHVFIPVLRKHLWEYGKQLKDPTQSTLRAKFAAAYYDYYLS
ncbi:MAG TPA: hypothetical protein VHP83_15710 [Aggregatilineaceae bacterium]|nr:hypothetical protein [Aggregatilineaceae bacterium]